MITTMQDKKDRKRRILKPTLYSQEPKNGKDNLIALTRTLASYFS